MNTRWLIVSIALSTIAHAAIGQTDKKCEAVLRPNTESSSSNYNLMQAFMSVNAEDEYDRLHALSSSARAADASYKLFSAEYEDSTSNSTFKEAVRKRLSKEEFSMTESDAKALYRETIRDTQIAAWAVCANDGAGRVLASGDRIDNQNKTFVLSIYWTPQTNVGQGQLEIEVRGGTIVGKRKRTESRIGSGGKSYFVDADKNSKAVTIIANIAGKNDSVMVSLVPSPTRPAVPAAGTVLQSGMIDVKENQECNPGDSDGLFCSFAGATITPKSANSYILLAANVQTDITTVTNADPWRRGEIVVYCAEEKKRTETTWAQNRHMSVQSYRFSKSVQCEPKGLPTQVSVQVNPRGGSVMTLKKPSGVSWQEIQK